MIEIKNAVITKAEISIDHGLSAWLTLDYGGSGQGFARLGKFDVHKSWHHSDGEPCFGGGWFIVVAQLPSGQVSNHYKADDWTLFDVPERETGAPYDGHTPAIALERLLAALTPPPAQEDR
jgi:hypothetical protein